MDEILSQFRTTALNPDSEETSGFEGLYKNWGKLGHQEQRRKDTLEVQRSNRNSKLDTCRGILDMVNEVEQQEETRKVHGELVHHRGNRRANQAKYRPNIYVAGFTKSSTTYKNVLMMSEWMIEKPEDFNENWFVIPCPKGMRTLLVACNGNTKFYTKHGTFRSACHTALPGGNPLDPNSSTRCVVLDCFHVESTNTMYVLDLLAWNNQPMSDGETEFRHFWMKTHIEDIPDLKTINPKNKIIFDILPKIDCTRESFNKFMMTLPLFKNDTPALDGLLFYHKLAHYTSGVTPLVGWLYPFMVNEVLGTEITVNPGYLVGRPIGYVNQARFIQEFEGKIEQRGPGFSKNANSMDVTSEGDETRLQKKGRHRKHKSRRSNNDSEMADGSEYNGWPPLASTFQLWTQQTETIKPRLTKIRPFVEKTG
ncbi:unnamed protein product [Arctia plantaginis]|uniref:Snurportin-1 n=1 Tax=Arctia plantaginis TaxID=874455 RepID=A0A8S1A3G0_ARCPL|nr:unnamed protein product [Arctia plantaginis]